MLDFPACVKEVCRFRALFPRQSIAVARVEARLLPSLLPFLGCLCECWPLMVLGTSSGVLAAWAVPLCGRIELVLEHPQPFPKLVPYILVAQGVRHGFGI